MKSLIITIFRRGYFDNRERFLICTAVHTGTYAYVRACMIFLYENTYSVHMCAIESSFYKQLIGKTYNHLFVITGVQGVHIAWIAFVMHVPHVWV